MINNMMIQTEKQKAALEERRNEAKKIDEQDLKAKQDYEKMVDKMAQV